MLNQSDEPYVKYGWVGECRYQDENFDDRYISIGSFKSR